MLNKIFSFLLFIFITILTLGLVVVLFYVGLIALWYLLIIALIIWAVRRLYYFLKGEQPPKIIDQYFAYYNRSSQQPGKPKRGRVIDYDDFKDK